MFPNYVLYYSNESELKKEINIDYTAPGWYQRGQDFVLILKDNDKLCAAIWDNRDPRNKWKIAVTLPLVNSSDNDVLHT